MEDSQTGEWITRRQAAELVRVHVNTIRLWEAAGKVESRRASNGLVLLRRDEMQEIAENRAADHALLSPGNSEEQVRMLLHQLDEANTRYDRLLDAYQRLVERQINDLIDS